jgi:biopolymer transport protein ExbB
MKTTQSSSSSLSDSLKSGFAASVILIELIIGFLIWKFVLGAPDNFVGGDPNNHPLSFIKEGIWYLLRSDFY